MQETMSTKTLLLGCRGYSQGNNHWMLIVSTHCYIYTVTVIAIYS